MSCRKQIALPWQCLSLLVVLMLPLAGCWDRTEVNDLALVTAAGLDKGRNGNVRLSLLLAVPAALPGASGGGGMMGAGGSTGGQQPTIVVSAEGVTVAEAMTKLQEKLPRRIFWGHSRVIVFGERLARDGIVEHLDFFARYPRTRLHAYVFVSKGNTEQVLTFIPPMERNAAETMRELAKFRISVNTTLKTLLQMFNTEEQTAVVPWIEPTARDGEEGQGIQLRINGAAIFKNGKMIGHASDSLTRGIMWVRNDIKTATVTVRVNNSGYVTLLQLNSRTTVKPFIENGKWKIALDIVTDDDIVQNTTRLNANDPNVTNLLEKKAEEEIKQRIREALVFAQKRMKADIFGFGEAFHRAYPEEWQKAKARWEELFPAVEVTVRVKANVRRSGLTNFPLAVPENEVKKP